MEKKRMRDDRRGLSRYIVVLLLVIGAGVVGYSFRQEVKKTLFKLGDRAQESPQEVYYCPMHPQYRSDRPGECPVCNMALVKLDPAQPASEAAPSERRILYWQDPMHPDYKSDKPGKAPDCGMDLVPVYADEATSAGSFPPGTVRISPQKQQLIGITTGEVATVPLAQTIRTVGKVTYDETRITRIHPKIEGWIEKVFVDYTGKFVRKGEPLVSLYSPELVATQQEYLLALRARAYLGRSSVREIVENSLSLHEASKKRLLLWDISEEEIREIERRGEPLKALTIYAPSEGYVLSRNAYERQRVTPETELYTIADLSTVWVLADIYEYEAPMVKIGQTGVLTLPYYPGKTFRGTVTYIYPQVDNVTRTVKIRLEFPNPGLLLKPDMYVNVELRVDYGRRVAVPEEAVLDSGEKQIVFVAHEGGYFEPRRVTLGQKVGNFFIVLDGLKPG
ncbi:MAG TPA: efflux RND transporter periplasmic adaptor subunit, partial [Blastocatellia bacterium]|nr:efflux RND transporter periplasmic adaptor subunit [Blastocatellia bacterium]